MAEKLTIGGIIGGILLAILFFGFLIWALGKNATDPTSSAIMQGSWSIIGILFLILLIIGLFALLIWFIKNPPQCLNS